MKGHIDKMFHRRRNMRMICVLLYKHYPGSIPVAAIVRWKFNPLAEVQLFLLPWSLFGYSTIANMILNSLIHPLNIFYTFMSPTHWKCALSLNVCRAIILLDFACFSWADVGFCPACMCIKNYLPLLSLVVKKEKVLIREIKQKKSY